MDSDKNRGNGRRNILLANFPSIRSDVTRDASAAVGRTRRLGISAGSAAVQSVTGAINAAGEVTGEASNFIRDTVMGVMEGTGKVAKISRPVVREVVAAAVRSSAESGGDIPRASQQAVEGAIVGAVGAGVARDDAVVEASAGVAAAVRELGGRVEDVVPPAMHGMIIGVVSTSGDLFQASRDTANSLLKSAAESGESITDIASMIVEEAVQASRLYRVGTTDAIMGSAQGLVEAGYELGVDVGDSVRFAVADVVDAPMNALAPTIRTSVTQALGELSEELRSRPHAWRGMAMWRAGLLLVRVNGLDVGAGLAYYLLLALFPLAALIILGFSSFIDPGVIRTTVTEVVVFYFPSSREFLANAIDHLYGARIWVSVIALGAMFLGAHGLFMAANRGVNHVFGRAPKQILWATVSTFGIVMLAVTLFLVSVGLTFAVQLVVTATAQIPAFGAPLNRVLVVVTAATSAIMPFMFAGFVFVVVYKYLPNQAVRWSDATFGGMVTVIFFEVAKYVFLIFAGIASQRNVLYGSLSSVILLLIWSHVAGLIFLYGAALTKVASELRPRSATVSLRQDEPEDVEADARREADIALGRQRDFGSRLDERDGRDFGSRLDGRGW